jgi:hypothetical protein
VCFYWLELCIVVGRPGVYLSINFFIFVGSLCIVVRWPSYCCWLAVSTCHYLAVFIVVVWHVYMCWLACVFL